MARYPEINRKAADLPPAAFHNLYMDLNGVIHNATHGNDEAVSYAKDPVAVASQVFAYVERVFAVVHPSRLLYIAVDGVAPRAKVNQQRQRRFKSAAETLAGLEAAKAAKQAAKEALAAVAAEEASDSDQEDQDDQDEENDQDEEDEADEEDEPKEVFDSNCITPGTAFMAELSQQLRYFIAHKMANDAEWQQIQVVLSGPEVPGEGEHKIMDFIRAAKSSPGYDPNTSHCLHGLDADLIMLGLATHEPHFTLVREKVVFGQSHALNERAGVKVQQTDDFEMLHLSILREYLLNEFRPRGTLAFPYDAERIIDDFVFMCFFIGNDFLPPLPLMDIDKGGLKVVFETYKTLLPSWATYLVSAKDGIINPDAMQALFDELCAREAKVLRATHVPLESAAQVDADAQAAVAADAQAAGAASSSDAAASTADDADATDATTPDDTADTTTPDYLLSMAHLLGVSPESLLEKQQKRRKRKTREPSESEVATHSSNALSHAEKQAWWYDRKFPHMAPQASSEYVHDVVSQYIQGLAWNLAYYYQGVLSWSWFYGYYQSPLLADMTDIRKAVVAYDVEAEPFAPFEQLMSVLPHYSASLLPAPLENLMVSPDSPLAEYFPAEYGYIEDDSGRSWKDIALIPFVDQEDLQTHVAALLDQLSEEDLARNTVGTSYVFRYAPDTTLTLQPPPSLAGALPPLVDVRVAMEPYTTPPLAERFEPKLCEGAVLPPASPIPGFPSFSTLRYRYGIVNASVETVASASREPSLVLLPDESALAQVPSGRYLAERYLGKVIHARWPYLVEARVEGVSDFRHHYYPGKNYADVKEDLSYNWNDLTQSILRETLVRHGIKLTEVKYVLHVAVLTSVSLLPDGSVHKNYGPDPLTEELVLVPLQLAVRTPPAQDPRYDLRPIPLPNLFKPGAPVAIVDGASYGFVGTVLERASSSKGKGEVESDDDEGQSGSSTDASYALNVGVTPPSPLELDLGHVLQAARSERYASTNDVAREVGMTQMTVSRITGAISVAVPTAGGKDRSILLGLGVKFSRRGLRIIGYARRKTIRKQNGMTKRVWEYSSKTINLLKTLKRLFPGFVNAFSRAPDENVFQASTLFGTEQTMKNMRRLVTWLSQLEVASLPLVPDDMASLSGPAIRELEAVMVEAEDEVKSDSRSGIAKNVPAAHMVNVHMISRIVTPEALPTRFSIGDRVRSIRPAGPVPFGMCGFIVTLRNSLAEVVFDLPLVSGSTLSGRISSLRGATISTRWLLNLSRPPPSAVAADPSVIAAKKAAAKAKAEAAKAAQKPKAKPRANNPFAALM